MATYRELFEKLGKLSQDQLDTEIKLFPVGYTDAEASTILNWQTVPQALELTKAVRDIYYYRPSEEDSEWAEPGVADYSEQEIKDLGINEDPDYTLVCHKGEIIFKIKDNVVVMSAADVAPDTSIMPL